MESPHSNALDREEPRKVATQPPLRFTPTSADPSRIRLSKKWWLLPAVLVFVAIAVGVYYGYRPASEYFWPSPVTFEFLYEVEPGVDAAQLLWLDDDRLVTNGPTTDQRDSRASLIFWDASTGKRSATYDFPKIPEQESRALLVQKNPNFKGDEIIVWIPGRDDTPLTFPVEADPVASKKGTALKLPDGWIAWWVSYDRKRAILVRKNNFAHRENPGALWDLSKQKLLAELPIIGAPPRFGTREVLPDLPYGDATCATFGMGQSLVMVASNDGRLRTYDAANGTELWAARVTVTPSELVNVSVWYDSTTDQIGITYGKAASWGVAPSTVVHYDRATGTEVKREAYQRASVRFLGTPNHRFLLEDRRLVAYRVEPWTKVGSLDVGGAPSGFDMTGDRGKVGVSIGRVVRIHQVHFPARIPR